ncbi:hypothetical protein MYAM1_001749 [Malassezia yamatoensis]|uniref:peptide chain release factor N(5)-glutamine methyltransferase n=1 Tax=Malassezia yamatoensis TaxID=253288 RepID=A0AAJ6CGP2_9BASI|nr:hypothetical protein MYAM1_001749 [Malassezia yamatoensis]
MTERVAHGEPLAYVIGHQPFGSLSLEVRTPVLIPRPETEEWVMRLAEQVNGTLSMNGPPFRILDLCTGSGCIALLLADQLRITQRPWRITALDCDSSAIELSNANVRRTSLPVDIVQADMFSDSDMAEFHDYDLVTCNPPYISSKDYLRLPRSILAYESRNALVGQTTNDGLDYYRRLAQLVNDRLLCQSDTRPRLVMEVGAGQSLDVLSLFSTPGQVWYDFAGHDRVVAID